MNLTLEIFGKVPLLGEGGILIKPLNFGQCCYHGHTLPPNITYHKKKFWQFFLFIFLFFILIHTTRLMFIYIISSYNFLFGPSSAKLFLGTKPGLEWKTGNNHWEERVGWVEWESSPDLLFQMFFFIDIYSFKMFFFIAVLFPRVHVS